MCVHLYVCFGEGCLFVYPLLEFSDAVRVCKHGTFSSVVLSNIASAGNVIAVMFVPPSLLGKKEHTKRKGRWRINLTTATLQKIVDCFHSQQACIPGLVHKRYGWCAAGRCVLLSWSLLSAVLTQVWPKVAKGQTPSQDWFWCLSSIIVIPDY